MSTTRKKHIAEKLKKMKEKGMGSMVQCADAQEYYMLYNDQHYPKGHAKAGQFAPKKSQIGIPPHEDKPVPFGKAQAKLKSKQPSIKDLRNSREESSKNIDNSKKAEKEALKKWMDLDDEITTREEMAERGERPPKGAPSLKELRKARDEAGKAHDASRQISRDAVKKWQDDDEAVFDREDALEKGMKRPKSDYEKAMDENTKFKKEQFNNPRQLEPKWDHPEVKKAFEEEKVNAREEWERLKKTSGWNGTPEEFERVIEEEAKYWVRENYDMHPEDAAKKRSEFEARKKKLGKVVKAAAVAGLLGVAAGAAAYSIAGDVKMGNLHDKKAVDHVKRLEKERQEIINTYGFLHGGKKPSNDDVEMFLQQRERWRGRKLHTKAVATKDNQKRVI